METTIYEGRADELNQEISYLTGLLDNYDPVEEAQKREEILKQIMFLRRFEETNAKVLLEAEAREIEKSRAEADAVEKEAKAKEAKRFVSKIDIAKIFGTVAGVILTFGVVRYQHDPDHGGMLPSREVSDFLKMFGGTR